MISYDKTSIRSWSFLGSCGAFGAAANTFHKIDPLVKIVTSDLCFYSGLDRFKKDYPDSLYNAGIAEQNMIGIAAGLAKEGFNVFATTYGTFAACRDCDQVRVNMGYMKFPIKLVGLTSGLSSGILGPTHMSLEDIAIFRAIPNITIISPADCTETVKASLAALQYNAPVYLRLTGGMGNPPVYKEDYFFEIGKAITLKQGTEVALVATGTMVHCALQVAKLLDAENITTTIIDMHTIKPLDTAVLDTLLSHKLIVTLEEHSVIGGLGGAVAEYLTRKQHRPSHLIVGIEDFFPHAGDYAFLLDECGLTPQKIYPRILEHFKELS